VLNIHPGMIRLAIENFHRVIAKVIISKGVILYNTTHMEQ
jgi:hypothetical protein